jgi:hypothetical protein
MVGNLLRKMESVTLYTQLGRLIETMPDLRKKISGNVYMPLGPDEMMWLGRAEALVAEAMGISGEAEFKALNQQFATYREWWASEIPKVLYRALAAVEVELPAPASGAFIPAGNSFDALKAVQRIFSLAQHELLIVDPYMDEKILTEFALLATENIHLKLLTDASAMKATLLPAAKAWRNQYAERRPINIKTVPGRTTIHDRLVVVDIKRVWTVGQSFKDLAVRAPTSFIEADPETAALKIAAYKSIWDEASEISV